MSILSKLNLEPTLQIKREKKQISFFQESLNESVAIAMVQIPAGSFEMGSPDSEFKRRPSEGPVHQVNLPGFWMSETPITQEQWAIVAKLPGSDHKLETHPSRFTGPKRPVEQVSWHDAVEFCQRLSQHTNRLYRLPSESEWEYACRAGTTTPFHFGETITTDLANYRGKDLERYNWSGSYGAGPKGICREQTIPVGQAEVANAFGLSGMHGNVWEWCEDIWHDDYKNAPTNGSAWVDGDDNSRILRGGAWSSPPEHCRSAYCYGHSPDYQDIDIGFRVVCSVRVTP